MELFTMLNSVIENIDIYEKMITIVVPLVGGIVAIIKWLSSIYATAMSSPVEVTLMTKKEQFKYKNSNRMMIWIAFSVLLIYMGFFALLYGFEQDKNDEVAAINDEQALEEVSTKETEYDLGVNEIEGEEITSNTNMIESVEQVDVIYAILFSVGFYGILAVCVIVIILFILCFIKHLLSFIKNIRKYLNERTVFWGASGGVTIVLCIQFLHTAKFRYFFVGCIVWALVIGYIVWRRHTCIEDVIEVLKFVSIVFIVVFLLAVNNIYIWTADNYNSVLSVLFMALGSIGLSAMICVLTSLIAKLNINQGKAKIKYFNKELDKDLYLYFRFKDEFFIAGEKDRIEDCDTYYLVKVDEVIGECLEKVTIQSANYSTVYSENIVLQIEEQPDVIMKDVFNKLGLSLRESKVSMDEYKKTKIYIKPQEGMVYFDLPCKKIAKDKQQFKLYN